MSLKKNISHKIKESFEAQHFVAPSRVWDNINSDLEKNELDNAVKTSFEAQQFKAPVFNFDSVSTSEIDKKIKDSFETNTLKAPSFNFENIKTFDTSLDQKVSDSFEAERNVLPDSIWRNIQNKMDVTSVWEGIAPNIKINTFSWRKLGVAVAIISFISLLPTSLKDSFSNITTQNWLKSNSHTNIKSSNLIAKQNMPELITEEKLKNKKSTQQNNSNLIAQNNLVNQISNQSAYNVEPDLREQKTVENINLLHAPFIQLKSSKKMGLVPSDFTTPPKQKSKSNFEIGLYASINNTWINNEDTRMSFKKNSLINSEMAFGESRGISGTYNFNEKFGLNATFLLQSKSRNKIGYYENGFYKLKTTELNYTSGFILANFYKPLTTKLSKLTKQTVSKKIAFAIGPYVAHQKNSFIYTDNVMTSYNSTFKDWDYGLKIQVGKEHKWSSLIFGYGVTSNIGMKNIILDQTTFSSNFNIGIYAALKYQLF